MNWEVTLRARIEVQKERKGDGQLNLLKELNKKSRPQIWKTAISIIRSPYYSDDFTSIQTD
jgi:hypothetical protein